MIIHMFAIKLVLSKNHCFHTIPSLKQDLVIKRLTSKNLKIKSKELESFLQSKTRCEILEEIKKAQIMVPQSNYLKILKENTPTERDHWSTIVIITPFLMAGIISSITIILQLYWLLDVLKDMID